MPQTLNIAVCEDEAAETVLLCDILNHSDIQNTYTVFLRMQILFLPHMSTESMTCCSWIYT